MVQSNRDESEIAKFSMLADQWWHPFGHCKPLHDINPLRMEFIQRYAPLEGMKILDVGCGGGILSESLAHAGAHVTGIDLSQQALEIARAHAQDQHLTITYEVACVEDFSLNAPSSFDIVTCMELLEHVPDPGSIIKASAKLLQPNGQLFLSTINRNPKAFLFAIVGAEYLLKLLPKGTHHYAKFIKPTELFTMVQAAGLSFAHTQGIHYHPVFKNYTLAADISVNYLVHCNKN
jgi:2-polyprenyl-6-hydroxyphenyl methylase / 3-demethylubiquinone-9 3-methyltransferase